MCQYCDKTADGNDWGFEEKNECFIQAVYWGKGNLTITGGVLTASDKLTATKDIRIFYCPFCGKELE